MLTCQHTRMSQDHSRVGRAVQSQRDRLANCLDKPRGQVQHRSVGPGEEAERRVRCSQILVTDENPGNSAIGVLERSQPLAGPLNAIANSVLITPCAPRERAADSVVETDCQTWREVWQRIEKLT